METPNLSVKDLGKLLNDSKAISDIARRQITLALENIVEEKAGVQMSNPMSHVRIEKGETVPNFLAQTPGIGAEVGQASSTDWEKTWANVIVWQRVWDKGPVIVPGTVVASDFNRELALKTFDKDETKILRDAGVL